MVTNEIQILQNRVTELERQLAEAEATSKNRISDTLNSVGDGLFVLNSDWLIIYVNQSAAQIAGLPVEELVGKNLWELWPELLGTSLESHYRQTMDERVPRHFRIEGIQPGRWYDVNVYPSSEGISIFYVDKTEQILAEECFNKAFQAIPYPLVISRQEDGRIEAVNEIFIKFFGYTEGEVIGKTSTELGMFVNPKDRQEAVQRLQNDKFVRDFELDVRLKSGEIRNVSLSIEPMNIGDKKTMLTIIQDISMRKQVEEQLKDYAEKLRRSNQELQEFAFTASHDLQEPLRKIESFGDLLLEYAPQLDERGRDYVERMQSAAGRMRSTVEGLLQLSRITTQGKPFIQVDLSQLTSDVLSDLENQIRRVNGKVDLGSLPTIEGDPLQLRQLMQNVISNALKYHQPDTNPKVKIYAKQYSDKVQIFIEDKGIGFDQEDAERIFQPFQRLVGRSEYEGTGMGLAICRRIVGRHRGEIAANSKPGQGATFVVTLPVSHPESARDGLRKDANDEEADATLDRQR